MTIARTKEGLLINYGRKTSQKEIESIVDFLEYKEAVRQSKATQKDVDKLSADAKKGRWEKIRHNYGL